MPMRDAVSATAAPLESPVGTGSPVLIVSHATAAARFPTGALPRTTASTTRDALRAIEQVRPAVVVVDWDCASIDAAAVCRAARRFSTMTIMASMKEAATAPAAIKAGCDAILLAPFSPLLASSRIARLTRRTMAWGGRVDAGERGTHQRYPGMTCPQCSAGGVLSFEFATRQTRWFACLQCDHVWDARPAS